MLRDNTNKLKTGGKWVDLKNKNDLKSEIHYLQFKLDK